MMSSMKKNPTIYDVAEYSGTSISTVSRVLNSPDKVRVETRHRVFAAIDALGFVPKAEARARALRRNGRIGVITPFFTAPSFVQRLRGIAGELSKKNNELVIFTVDSIDRLQSYLTSLPLTGNLDGLVIMSLPVDDVYVDHLLKHDIPTVLIEFPNKKINSVEIDDVAGGRMVAEYLVAKGHRRIAFIGDTDLPEYAIHPVSLRLVGFRKGLEEADIVLKDEFVRLAPYTMEQTRQAAIELLNTSNPPTAVFAATDFQALSMIQVAHQLGVRIPDELAVIGFDDLDMAEFADLTTVRQHLDESGRLAIEILLAHIEDNSRPVQHIKLPLTIIERLSA
jgi:DNA-binding LacI/PurR family transcriptional regulator